MRLSTHVSIDTGDLAGSTRFYRALLGAEPILERGDYVRFDVPEPALALGLNAVRERPGAATGPLEHLGVRFPDDAALDAARARLVAAGVATEDEPDVTCCYARMARVWATDPSGVRWELFLDRETIVEAASRSEADTACCAPTCCAGSGEGQ